MEKTKQIIKIKTYTIPTKLKKIEKKWLRNISCGHSSLVLVPYSEPETVLNTSAKSAVGLLMNVADPCFGNGCAIACSKPRPFSCWAQGRWHAFLLPKVSCITGHRMRSKMCPCLVTSQALLPICVSGPNVAEGLVPLSHNRPRLVTCLHCKLQRRGPLLACL